jgi:hypothetical protein
MLIRKGDAEITTMNHGQVSFTYVGFLHSPPSDEPWVLLNVNGKNISRQYYCSWYKLIESGLAEDIIGNKYPSLMEFYSLEKWQWQVV